ncbi:hypothetical protein Acr_19g0006770 [Actinidia rufa]|uniref:Uncharacterized protein n=1 Tax=Actinidia rufa TaxID=165716 RepID=A0A7J0GAC3_9ERIC|nr:hypothetical protein Acr_19g0006770 [Actinidia rufa]
MNYELPSRLRVAVPPPSLSSFRRNWNRKSLATPRVAQPQESKATGVSAVRPPSWSHNHRYKLPLRLRVVVPPLSPLESQILSHFHSHTATGI